jgi:hypothetical protein
MIKGAICLACAVQADLSKENENRKLVFAHIATPHTKNRPETVLVALCIHSFKSESPSASCFGVPSHRVFQNDES